MQIQIREQNTRSELIGLDTCRRRKYFLQTKQGARFSNSCLAGEHAAPFLLAKRRSRIVTAHLGVMARIRIGTFMKLQWQ